MFKQLILWVLTVVVTFATFILLSSWASALPKVTMAGDYGYNGAMRNTIDNIAAQNPDVHFALGDLAYDAISPQAWCEYVRGKFVPFEIVLGNHDVPDDEADYLRYCPSSINQVGEYARQSYYDLGGARFITTDIDISPVVDEDYRLGQPKGDWLKATVESAKAQGMWVIVMSHKVCVSSENLAGHECEIDEYFLNYLLDWGVDLVWQGHAHSYQRSKQFYNYTGCVIRSYVYDSDCMRATNNYPRYPAGGMHLVINGTGGRALVGISTSQPDYPYFRKADASSHGPSTLYVGAESLHMVQKTNADGTIDEFWIDR